ncbi:MAG: family 10 glycosylhydrolase [Phormidesmis sp. RL_2_1]|nr:family 10 glycosylhydrolase [Phormidesmis sp. RL_2_1]
MESAIRYIRARRNWASPQNLWLSLVALLLLFLISGWGLFNPLWQSPRSADHPTGEQARQHPAEIRGVWITNVASSILFAPWGIPRALHQLADMHFNTVYPVVWNRGTTFYRSAALQHITGQTMEPLMALTHPWEDPLREMVRIGHQHKLRVMPWFEYGFMVPMKSPLAQQHPNWLTTRQNGSQWLKEGAFEGNEPPQGLLAGLLRSGAPSRLGWLNPLHPGVQGLLLGLIEEVVSEYDVDGIQLDDHFSWPVEFGYDPYTISLYQAEHQGQSPPNNPADPDWIRWRAAKLSQFVNVVHARVKAKCPTCTISISPNPAKFAYRFHLQDWLTWVNQGWVDELVVQIYRDQLEMFDRELSKGALQKAMARIPVSIGILTGTWRRPIPFAQIQAQVERSRDRRFSGVSFFYWDTLWSYFTPESPEKRRQNFRDLLPEVF